MLLLPVKVLSKMRECNRTTNGTHLALEHAQHQCSGAFFGYFFRPHELVLTEMVLKVFKGSEVF
jgi:hypothetical protein